MLSRKSSFYLTLTSIGSKDVFPNNKANSYKNQFPRALQLDGDWEVALSEVTYPGTTMSMEKPVKIQIFIFRNDTLGKLKGTRTNTGSGYEVIRFELPLQYNLPSQGHVFGIIEGDDDNVESIDNLLVEIPVGKYTPKTLVEKFKQLLATQLTDIQPSVTRPFHHLMELTFDETKNRVRSESLHQVLIVYYKADDASSLFGLPKLTDTKFSAEFHLGKHEFPFPPLRNSSQSLFIYTDIIDNDLVGDALVPLLRAVDVLDDPDVIVHKAFDLGYYKPVIRTLIPSIEIQINSETGALVNFTSGEVICLLHFRKRNHRLHKSHH